MVNIVGFISNFINMGLKLLKTIIILTKLFETLYNTN